MKEHIKKIENYVSLKGTTFSVRIKHLIERQNRLLKK